MDLKNDESLQQALKNTGDNLTELTSDIFVHVRDEDIPNLNEKLKETGFFSQNPRFKEAFAEKLQQIGNSSNVVKAFKFSAIFCVLFFKLFWFYKPAACLYDINELQGDPNQSFPFQMAVTLKLSSSDPMLVKPKCVWEVAVFWKIANKQLTNVNKFLKIEKKLPLLKAILALPL